MAKFTLYDRDGKKYETGDKTEAVRLKSAHGYTETAPKSSSPKSDKS
jgi:hypothetical protein